MQLPPRPAGNRARSRSPVAAPIQDPPPPHGHKNRQAHVPKLELGRLDRRIRLPPVVGPPSGRRVASSVAGHSNGRLPEQRPAPVSKGRASVQAQRRRQGAHARLDVKSLARKGHVRPTVLIPRAQAERVVPAPPRSGSRARSSRRPPTR